MSPRGLILLRTHFVDDRVVELAQAYARGGEYDVRLAVDETSQPVDARGLPKLSLTLDSCARLGLPVSFLAPLWLCGDYLFYHALPLGHARLWSIEYDVAVNFADPLDFFRRLDDCADEDYLAVLLQVAAREWIWRKAAARRFPVVYSSCFALVRLSAEAVSRLLARRRQEAAWLAAEKLAPHAHWINDETFVSSAIPDLGLGMADFNAHGEVYTPQTFMRDGIRHPRQLPPPDGRVYHAVRTGAAYLAAARSYYRFDLATFLADAEPDLPTFPGAAADVIGRELETCPDDPAAVFGPAGALAPVLARFANPRLAAALMQALARRRLRLCLEALQFGRIETPVARTPSHDNLALGRPAWQSSVCARSHTRDLRRDAENGNDGDIGVEYGFHTAQEESPWWAVDLGAEHTLGAVRLYNRPLYERRLRGFVIETSLDFLTWTTAHAHDPADAKALLARPLQIVFSQPIPARYLRVRLARRGVLHLAEVEAIRA